jgi:hypothetical protein
MFKHITTFLVIFLTTATFSWSQGVGINSNSAAPDPSAILDVSAGDKGMLIPRMTQSQRNAISNPVEGLQIYNTTTKCFNFYTGATWRQSCYECDFLSPSVGNNGPICEGSTLNLSATFLAGATYSWTGPNGFSSAQQSPSITGATAAAGGVYSLQVTLNGCTSSPVSTIATVNSTPQTPAAGNNGPVCEGTPVSLTASSILGATYTWSGPNGYAANTQNPVVSPTLPSNSGVYSVVATVNGCSSASGTTNVTVHAAPNAIAGSNSPVCPGNSVDLTASTISGATYLWSGPNGFSSGAQNPSVVNANSSHQGSYSVTATANGCTGALSSTLVVVADPAPSTPGSVSGITIGVAGQSVVYSIAPVTYATSYTWSVPAGSTITSGQGTTSMTVTLGNNSGSVCVTASNSCGTSAQSCGNVSICSGATNWLTNSVSWTQNSPTYASSWLDINSYPPTKTVDGNAGDGTGRWVSAQYGGMPQWIAYDLGSQYYVDQFRMWNLQNDHANQGAKDFQLQVANSITGPWTDVLTAQAQNQSSSWQAFNLPNPAISRYWRVNVTSIWDNTYGWVQIMEMGWKGCQ